MDKFISFMEYKLRMVEALMMALLVCLICLSGISPAHAQVTRLPNIRPLASAVATAGTTFATTSYADLTGATITFTPAKDYATTGAPGEPNPVPHLHVYASLDVTKATTTTGTCALYANGAVIAASARTIDVAAKEGTMTLLYDVAEATSGSQVVKLQCKSGDTAVFTVNNGQLYVEEHF